MTEEQKRELARQERTRREEVIRLWSKMPDAKEKQ
jgi:hypothetical protein